MGNARRREALPPVAKPTALALDDPAETPALLDWVFAPGDPYRLPPFVSLDLPAGTRLANTTFRVEGE